MTFLLEKQLIDYAMDSENPLINYNIAITYDNINQIASAISHYLRCAERSNDKTLQYECLVLAGLGIKRQGSRLYTEKSFFQNAISVLPHRPEAYLFIADTFIKMGLPHNAFTMLSIGEQYCKNPYIPFKNKIEYNGELDFKKNKKHAADLCGIELND